MKWEDLLRNKITELEDDRIKTKKLLEKEMDKAYGIGKKTELLCKIESIQKAQNVLYECIGRSSEVTE